MELRPNPCIPLQHYGLAGPFLSDEIFSYALPPSEAQRPLSNFHTNCFFSSDILANSKLGWCIFPSISHTMADHLGSWAKLVYTSARNSCCVTTGDCNIFTQKDHCRRLNQDLDLYNLIWKMLRKCKVIAIYCTKMAISISVPKWEKDP